MIQGRLSIPKIREAKPRLEALYVWGWSSYVKGVTVLEDGQGEMKMLRCKCLKCCKAEGFAPDVIFHSRFLVLFPDSSFTSLNLGKMPNCWHSGLTVEIDFLLCMLNESC